MAINLSHLSIKRLISHTHPIHRLLISISVTIVAYFLFKDLHLNQYLHSMILWDVFAFSMVSTSWVVIFTRTTPQIRKVAKQEDGSLLYVYILVLVASFASMLTVMLLMMANDTAGIPKLVYLPVVISGLMLSWVMVHTTFTFHYARLYYSNDEVDESKHAAGLAFPEEDCPDYLDFAYYAFVIGMTFQVSDVETRTRLFRRITLMHSVISFGLNTFVVALTINLIASLKA